MSTKNQQLATVSAPLADKMLILADDFSLLPADTAHVKALLVEYKTKLPTIRYMLDAGLDLAEVREVLEARNLVNDGLLTPKDGKLKQQFSIKAYLRFKEAFPEVPTDAETLATALLELNERLQEHYFTTALNRLIEMKQKYPDALLDTLTGMIAQETDFVLDRDHTFEHPEEN